MHFSQNKQKKENNVLRNRKCKVGIHKKTHGSEESGALLGRFSPEELVA